MREIKYKVWDGYEMRKVWKMIWSATDGLLSFLVKSKEADHYAGALSSNDSRCNLMQFTGLTDKNGVEIYEGDIIKWVQYNRKYIGKIYSNNIEFRVITKAVDYFLSGIQSDFEVIGNIYENPELLDVNND
jgi:uncharacterized phage protein (TIGR01671 family)